MKSRLIGAAQNLALVLVSLAVGLLLIEWVGRASGLLAPPERMFRYSSTKGYELAPGQGEINALGFRDADFSRTKPEGTFRVLALGDSFTFGDGVPLADAYPQQLEEALNARAERAPVKFEVLNAGVPGYNTSMEAIHLTEVGLSLEPDLIIVGFNLNDAELGAAGLKDVESSGGLMRAKEWVKANFALYGLLRARVKALVVRFTTPEEFAGTVDPSITPLARAAHGRTSPGWERCRDGLEAIAASATRHGIPVLLVIFPKLVGLDGSYPYRAEHELVALAAAEAGMRVVDLLPAYTGRDPASLWVSPRDGHPNPAGHAIAARAIHEAMSAQELLPVDPGME